MESGEKRKKKKELGRKVITGSEAAGFEVIASERLRFILQEKMRRCG